MWKTNEYELKPSRWALLSDLILIRMDTLQEYIHINIILTLLKIVYYCSISIAYQIDLLNFVISITMTKNN